LQNDVVTAYRNYEFHTMDQKSTTSCVVELGGFYLDIIKELALHDGRGQRAAPLGANGHFYHVAHAMVPGWHLS